MKKAPKEKEERTPLNPSIQPSDDTQGSLQGGEKTADEEQSPDNSEEDCSTSQLPEGAALLEELENNLNGVWVYINQP